MEIMNVVYHQARSGATVNEEIARKGDTLKFYISYFLHYYKCI